MTIVTTTRRIDLPRLDADLGGVGLRMDGKGYTDDEKVITAPDTVTEAALRATIDAHVWVDRAGNQATLRQQAHDSLATLRTSIDTLKAITDKTNANIGPADTKAIARETRRVARQVLAVSRLMLGALDNIDIGAE